MQWIWILFRGYVIIKVIGVDVERFINICVHRKLILFDIRRGDDYVILKMPAYGFKITRSLARKTNCKVKILKKRGFSFFFRKYKKRKSFVFGGLMFVTIFTILWSYIWDIELVGNSILKESDIVKYLEKNNIKVGSIKYFLNTNKIEDDIILNFKDLSWVDVKIRGTKLIINAISGARIPDIVDENLPCNIIAKRDGVVTSVLVKNGVEVVKVGDTVLKNDTLISGIMSQSNMIHAIGSVRARTWYEKSEEVKLIEYGKKYTGHVLNNYKIEIFNRELFKLNFGKEHGNYDKINKVINFRLFKNFVIPFKIKREKRVYYIKDQKVVTMSDAKKEAFNKALNSILKSIDKNASIVKQQIDYFYDNGKIFVKVYVEVDEEIGTEKVIE